MIIDLGTYVIGTTIRYRGNFHNDQGTLEDPTAPEAQLEKPDGTFAALTAPAKVNAQTGHFGGSIATTGYAAGMYHIRMAGTVATAKVTARELRFRLVSALQQGQDNIRVVAGDTFKYRVNFHDDTLTLADPATPAAQLEDPAGTFSALTDPAKINSKTGHFGGSVDTTGYAAGQYFIRVAGTVATARAVAGIICFQVQAGAAAGDSLRQQILDAVETRFKTIVIANGYQTDIGADVFVWKQTPFQDAEIPGMDIRDMDDAAAGQTVGEEIHTIPFEVKCLVTGSASMEDVRKVTADITQAIGVDVTWGGLAQDTGQVQGGLGTVEVGDKVVTAVEVRFEVTYTSARFSPYA